MAVFETSGKRGQCLDKLYNYVLTVPPTSVEAERAFSAAGVLCTKLRSQLEDNINICAFYVRIIVEATTVDVYIIWSW